MTARRIELFGPSGVGKSAALSLALPLLADLPGLIGPAGLTILHNQRRKTLDLAVRRAAVTEPDLAPFLDAALSVATRCLTSPGRRMLLVEQVLQSTRRHVTARASPAALVVHDELLLNRAFSLLTLSPTPQPDAERLFSTVPLPEAVVLCQASVADIMSRHVARGRDRLTYGDGSEPDLASLAARTAALCTLAAEVLERRGLRLHHLDLSGPQQDGAIALATLLRVESNRAT